jgi:hypothetical protein
VIRGIILLSHSAISILNKASGDDPVGRLLPHCDVINEVAVASDAGRSSARVGHHEPAAGRIVVADQVEELVTGKRRPPVPVAEHREVLSSSRTCIDPMFKHWQLLKQDCTVAILSVSARVAATLKMNGQQTDGPRQIKSDVHSPA